jgi:hypothetical protein
MKAAKVDKVETGKTWTKDGVEYITHTYTLSDGQVIQANHKTEKPINIGEEVEYEVKRTHEKYGDSGTVKKPNDFKKGGGYKKPQLKLVDAQRMASSNAIHAVVTINSTYNEERIKGTALKEFEAFTLGDISEDIDKFSEQDSLFTSRLSSLNNAAAMSGYKSYKIASDVLEEAKKLYNYITRK